MRTVVIVATCLVLTGVGRGPADVSGSAHVGAKPAPEAVVWLDAPSAPRPEHPSKVVLDQRNLSFSPHVLAVQTGTRVEFPNHDRVFHSVFSYKDGKPFDLGLYPVGTVKQVMFDQSGLSRIFCNIHPHMTAYVMVVDTPYFAVSNDAGAFTIAEVPAGIYRYHAWRPGGDVLTGETIVRSGTVLEVRWPG